MQTIIDFTNDKVSIPDYFGDVNLQKKRWSDLEINTRKRFWNYSLIVEMLDDVNDAPIRNIFERINRNSRKLTAQEMRHAKCEGWFIGFVEAEAEKFEWKKFGVVTPARIKRMLDVQFISELFAIVLKGEILGFDQVGLDDIYADYEDILDVATFVEDDFANAVEATKGKIGRDSGVGTRSWALLKGSESLLYIVGLPLSRAGSLPRTRSICFPIQRIFGCCVRSPRLSRISSIGNE